MNRQTAFFIAALLTQGVGLILMVGAFFAAISGFAEGSEWIPSVMCGLTCYHVGWFYKRRLEDMRYEGRISHEVRHYYIESLWMDLCGVAIASGILLAAYPICKKGISDADAEIHGGIPIPFDNSIFFLGCTIGLSGLIAYFALKDARGRKASALLGKTVRELVED